jgi:hypothetical protein
LTGNNELSNATDDSADNNRPDNVQHSFL